MIWEHTLYNFYSLEFFQICYGSECGLPSWSYHLSLRRICLIDLDININYIKLIDSAVLSTCLIFQLIKDGEEVSNCNNLFMSLFLQLHEVLLHVFWCSVIRWTHVRIMSFWRIFPFISMYTLDFPHNLPFSEVEFAWN